VAAGLYAISKYTTLANLNLQEGLLSNMAPQILSSLVAAMVLFLLYFVLPNTRVSVRAAIGGAILAAIVWVVAKTIYGYCVTQLGLYRSLYGMLALFPITVMWIHITWLIVLFGLQLTYTTQHLKSLDAAEIAAAKKTEEYFIANDVTAFNIVREIAEAFKQDRAPLSGDDICGRLDMPAEFGHKILDHLVDSKLVVKTSEPQSGFVLAKDPANVKLSEIAAVVANAGFAQSPPDKSESLDEIALNQRLALERHTLKDILNSKPD
jgi:membrane protein